MLIEQKEQTEKEILMNKSEQKKYQIKIDENKKQITEFDEHALEKIKQEKNQISSSLSEKDQGIDYTILNQVLKENSFEISFEKDEIHDIDTA
ncbi:MAG: hypothetical protein K6E76_03735 [Patescibacteria group bacterium]|nr:hypothetical protein [Patescibacteria group bacterium]